MKRRDFFKKIGNIIGGSALIAVLPAQAEISDIPTTGDRHVNVGFQPDTAIIFKGDDLVSFNKDDFTFNHRPFSSDNQYVSAGWFHDG